MIKKYQKKQEALEQERSRLEGMRVYEHRYEHLGAVCGIDEAGEAPWRGLLWLER